MRRLLYGPPPWNLLPPEPPRKAAFRRWNIIIMLILAFVVAGVWVAGVGSQVKNNGLAQNAGASSHAPHARSRHIKI